MAEVKLSILIATVHGRHSLFQSMWEALKLQAEPFGEQVEIISRSDNKEISVGRKRQLLLEEARGEHVLFADDDDFYHPWYISDLMRALESDPDCVGSVIEMTYNGQPHYKCVHSLQYKTWSEHPQRTPYGNAYQRNVTHRNAVRRSIALQVGFPDLRFGEDKVYSDGVTALCKTEVMVDRPGFVYRYSSAEEHNAKYGIR